MKIAIDFKNEKTKEFVGNELSSMNWKYDYSSCGSMWIYDIHNVCVDDRLQLQKKDLKFAIIPLNCIEYFEIHCENKKRKVD